MASIFTYDPNPPRVASPWSTPKSLTPKLDNTDRTAHTASQELRNWSGQVLYLDEVGISRLEPEPQEGPTEYKLHLLLRPRTSSAAGLNNDDSRANSAARSPHSGSNTPTSRAVMTPSLQTRQNRLQHLTTQLLWRLQQSSPFHSSSSVNLVLPLLPEATPQLGVPSKPAQLLPGLEESQGALYEIGVADDGAFIGLREDEMEESLTNLRAMAASLGCRVEILRKVLVGQSISDTKPVYEPLFVTEALVHPDLEGSRRTAAGRGAASVAGPPSTGDLEDVRQSETEQIRISLVGASTSGKSTLLGVLTSSNLDNGRGKSRISLLKHRHEVSSGITSSVAQELVGYSQRRSTGTKQGVPDIVNYGLTNVESWNDIHSLTTDGRLAFFSDSPGQPRYSKSTFRTMMSWKPHWVVLCVSAVVESETVCFTGGSPSTVSSPSETAVSMSYLTLCLKMGIPFVLAITKLDLATKSGLRTILGNVLSALKAAGRKPIIVPSSVPSRPSANGNLSAHSPAASEAAQTSSPNSETYLQHISESDMKDVSNVVIKIKEDNDLSIVPIVLVSSVNGTGIGKLHALVKSLPILEPRAPEPVGKSIGISPLPSFHVDEIFAIPISKVYSPSGTESAQDSGVVLCGHLSNGTIHVGDEMLLGPFGTADEVGALSVAQSAEGTGGDLGRLWAPVKVVSIRNLRLPVRRLLEGQVGTLGAALRHPFDEDHVRRSSSFVSLAKARRGMVLVPPNILMAPEIHTSLSAVFSLEDFEDPSSPSLIMGGQAMIYVNSIRAPVKVISVQTLRGPEDGASLAGSLADISLDDEHDGQASKDEDEDGFFGFDDDHVVDSKDKAKGSAEIVPDGQVKIEFSLLRWPEAFASGDRILVIPSASQSLGVSLSTSGPGLSTSSFERTGSYDNATSFGAVSNGLSGFVGYII